MPTYEVWLLARRSVSKPSEVAYYLSNAEADTPLALEEFESQVQFHEEETPAM